MTWTTPTYTDMRFGFEVTMYIATRWFATMHPKVAWNIRSLGRNSGKSTGLIHDLVRTWLFLLLDFRVASLDGKSTPGW